jgi:serine/threonine protein kinase
MQLTELRGYRIIRPLGQGGFGKTYLAEDLQSADHQRYVIKQLSPQATDPESYRIAQERFQREAAVLLELSGKHPQIPRLYSYFFHDQDFYLVQEYIEGLTLSQKWQQSGNMTEGFLRPILSQILQILRVIHAEKLIHRDVKPDNIILREQDQKPVLIDFGAVKESVKTILHAGANPSIVIGSLGFMPPEQAAGRPTYASDLYSLAMTAIYLLTGKPPQTLEVNPATHELLWATQATGLSSNLVAVLTKAIKFNPRDRYATAQEMLFALESKLSIPPTYAEPLSLQSESSVPAQTQATLAVFPGNQSLHPAPPNEPTAEPPDWQSPSPKQPLSKRPLLWAGTLLLGLGLGLGGFYLYAQGSEQATLEEAQGLKSLGKFEDCILSLTPLPRNSSLVDSAQKLKAECQLALAKQLAQQGKYSDALQRLTSIDPTTAIAPESTRLAQTWRDRLLEQAKQKYLQGDIDQAIALAEGIPVGNGQRTTAQESIKTWQQEWQQNRDRFKAAQTALDNRNWQQAIDQANLLTTPYWQNKAEPILQRAIAAQDNARQPTPPPTVATPDSTSAPETTSLEPGQAISMLEQLYSQLSQKDYAAAESNFSPALAATFDPGFFDQFARVSVENLAISSQTNDSINFIGENTYVWPDGSTQRERRSFTVRPVTGRLRVTASEFIKVLQLRSQR